MNSILNIIKFLLPFLKEQKTIPPSGARGIVRGILFLLLFIAIIPLWGQGGTFPVQVIPQAVPPAPIFIANYADASTVSSPLRVQIILNDFEIANREIRLKVSFEGSGLSFQSNDFVVGASPLFLEGGIPLVLTNAELAPYFEFNNISGISPNQYANAIPEGAYQFCVEVFDVLTGSRLSNKSCAVSVVFQNEPPFLVNPRNRDNVAEVNPQYILFQWTPRNINVSNVDYELSLVEIWDPQVDPQQAFLSSPPVFQTTTTTTTYVYGPSDPQLLSGKKYAWRVQAKAKQGTEEIGLFKNQGFSEIFSFSYAGSCELPSGVNHEVKGSTNTNIFWDDFSTEIPEYTVRYRKKSPSSSPQEGENAWFESKTTTNLLTIWDLKAGTTYEYQVNKKCAITESDWSFEKQFTTHIADDEESVYECGIQPDFNLTNQDPLENLVEGDKFTAGDFPIKVITASGSNGRFTGTGYVTIPYLSSIKVGVEFTNVLINTDNQLFEGSVITMYDESLSNILDIDEAIDTLDDIADAAGELFEGDNDLDEIRVNWTLDPENDIEIVDGNVVITNPENGESVSEPLGDDKVVVDGSGQVYHIDAGGNVTAGGTIDPGGSVNSGNVVGVSNNGKLESLTAEGIQVTFNSPSTYGFDQMPAEANDKLKKEYTSIQDAKGTTYVLPHHAVKKGEETQITATVTIENDTYTAEDVIFKTKQGETITATGSGNTRTLSIKSNYTFENETIYAVVESKQDTTKQLTAGAFTLWHLTDRVIDVALVSVNGASLGNIESTVKNIYQKGVATINFQTPLQLSVEPSDLGDNGLDVGESAWAAAYNDEQKQLISAVQDLEDYQNETYYILVFGDDIQPSRSIAGFMPLQRQIGFVFNGTKDEEDKGGDKGKVLAHELGHGVFAIQHPFAEYGADMENKTDWLMDYNSGTGLPHTHWAQIHDPALKFYVFQDEEDGEIAKKIWFTPDWEPFSVENTSTITSVKIDNVPLGTIPGFKLNGKLYHAEFEASKFLGYFANYKKEDTAHDEYIPNKIASLDSDSNVYLFQYNGGCGYNRYYETKFYYANANNTSISYGSDTNVKFVGTIPCAESGTENKNPFKASICELIDENDVANSSGIEMAVEKLNEAYKKRETLSDNNSPRNKGEFFHLVNVSANDLDGRAQVIEDKLYLLKQETGTNFFVVFQPVDTKMNAVARDDFAQQVLNQSDLGQTAGKNVVVTVPYFTLTPLANFSAINCIQPGFAQSNSTIVRNQNFGFKQNDNLLEYVLGAFSDIEKPLFLRRYFLKANGTLVNQEIATKSGKLLRGYPYINEVEFYESPSLFAIKLFQSAISQTSPEDNEVFDVPEFLEIRNGWVNTLNNIFIEAEQEEIKSFKENNLSYWGDKKDIEIGGFREAYVRNIDLTNTYVSTNIKGTYLESWKIIFAKSNLEPKHLYDFDIWSVVDQTIYNGLDIVSLIPVADTFADLGGLLYAGVRGDLQNTVIYAGSLVIPFAGAGYLKGVKNGVEYADEAYAITAKKVNGNVQFDVKKVSELNPDELQVSTILTNDPDIAKKIGDENIKKYVNEGGINKLLDNSTNVIDDALLSALKSRFNSKPNLLLWIDDISDNSILKRLDVWDSNKIDDLNRRLGDTKYSGLANELKDSDYFKLYDEIVDDPENAIDIAKQGGDAILDKVGRSTFFKEITDLGRLFEIKMLEDVLDNTSDAYKKLNDLVPDLADRKVLSQVQFCIPGKKTPCNAKGDYFIADAVFVKYDSRGRIVDMIVTDSKLSKGTKLTSGQTSAKNGIGEKLSTRSNKRTLDANNDLLPGGGINQNSEIVIKDFYKIYGDGKGIFQGIE